ncbi:MAG: tRNA (adenosine(37)-N6)-threonylcarbamoyltransferase complex ATPase subunit type 1 TsaE [Cyanobacteria bacterium P01_G01_bin.39]
MTTLLLSTSEDTFRLGYELGRNLVAGTTLLLTGNLGAGKTTLVQGIGEGLLIPEPVVSPTFTLINEYLDGRLPLYHLDLYRLEPNQVENIYPEIYWSGIEVDPGITVIEWSEHLPFKPVNYLEIKLSAAAYGRKARLQFQGKDIYNLEFTEGFTQLSQPSSAP